MAETNGPRPAGEREITERVDLCRPDGRLAPDAAGWTRRPLHRANLRGWGRTKRWEYWCLTTPAHVVAVTVSDLDFLALTSAYLLDRETGRDAERTVLGPGGRGVQLPDTIAGAPVPGGPPGAADVVTGPERPVRGQVRVEIREADGGTRLRARFLTPERVPVDLDAHLALPAGHETLGVVVPWSDRRFQYTAKHTARPAAGRLRIGDTVHAFADDAWGVLDHGRGRWPRDVAWNWGAASGRSAGRTLGLQFGGRWTAGTGATENALCVDGRLTKISEELDWAYDTGDFSAPWTVRTPATDQVDLVFTPVHERATRTEALVLANRTHQCFGRWTGTVRETPGGAPITVDGLFGWAEDVHMRW